MKTLGIITEYNPFHQGHAYMLERAKRKADADRVVVIMSGSFVQRGEPAIFDKWTRTAAALKNGADLVLELPVLFAAANAEAFARGAVRLLTESGIVDTLWLRKRQLAGIAGGGENSCKRNRGISTAIKGAAR